MVDVESAANQDNTHATPFLRTFARFLKYHIRHLCTLSGAALSAGSARAAAAAASRTSSSSAAPFGFGVPAQPGEDASAGARKPATAATLSMSKDLKEIRSALFDALRAFLDGCEWLASQWRPAGTSERLQTDHSFQAKLYGNSIQLGFGDQGAVSMSSRRKTATFRSIDVHDADKRLLLVLLHVDQLIEFVLPSSRRGGPVLFCWGRGCLACLGYACVVYPPPPSCSPPLPPRPPTVVELFETKFSTVCPTHVKEFKASLLLLHSILFQNYLRRKTARLAEVVAEGIMFSGLDWNRLSKPQDVRVSLCVCVDSWSWAVSLTLTSFTTRSRSHTHTHSHTALRYCSPAPWCTRKFPSSPAPWCTGCCAS